MKAVVAFPGNMAHAVQAALALHEGGCLARFETGLAYRSASWFGKLVRGCLRAIIGDRADRELQRRALPLLPWCKVRTHPFGEMLRVVASRSLGPCVTDAVWEQSVMLFDQAVAGGLSPLISFVSGFEHTCQYTLQRAARLGIARGYHMAAPHYDFSERVIRQEIERYPELRTPYRQRVEKLARRRNHRKDREFELAQIVFANSRLTARTYVEAGYDPGRVRVVPLGAPPVQTEWRAIKRSGPVTILYAGPASVRKGAHHLLASWQRLGAPAAGRLLFAGSWDLPETVPPNVVRLGNLTQSELFAHYRRASVLVFPSLCDGFGMVVSEALANGLPVITTDHVGAADLITSGRNGFVLPAGNVDRLTEMLDWCLRHPKELEDMRPEAEKAAGQRQWSHYRSDLLQYIQAFMRAPIQHAHGTY